MIERCCHLLPFIFTGATGNCLAIRSLSEEPQMRACTQYDSRRGAESGLSRIEGGSIGTCVGAVAAVVTEASICFLGSCLVILVPSVNPTNDGERACISPQKSKRTRLNFAASGRKFPQKSKNGTQRMLQISLMTPVAACCVTRPPLGIFPSCGQLQGFNVQLRQLKLHHRHHGPASTHKYPEGVF